VLNHVDGQGRSEKINQNHPPPPHLRRASERVVFLGWLWPWWLLLFSCWGVVERNLQMNESAGGEGQRMWVRVYSSS